MRPNIESEDRVILAIEAAVRGGSIALLKNDIEIAAWHGTTDVSRAEDLLQNISELFDRTQVDKSKVDLVAVSNGPGSYTGIRIGLATALGLASALSIECIGVPLMAAAAKMYGKGKNCVVVIPIGRNDVCWEAFDASERTNSFGSATGSANDLLAYFRELDEFDLFMQHDAFEIMAHAPNFDDFRSRAYDCGRNLALAVGRAARTGISDLTPNYVRNPHFKSTPV